MLSLCRTVFSKRGSKKNFPNFLWRDEAESRVGLEFSNVQSMNERIFAAAQYQPGQLKKKLLCKEDITVSKQAAIANSET